jgi:7-cyano-7-deazaguanine synthase in queuosine biosynthesis
MSSLQHSSSATGVSCSSGAALTDHGTIGIYHGNRSSATGCGACGAVENESNSYNSADSNDSNDSNNKPGILGIYESEEEE